MSSRKKLRFRSDPGMVILRLAGGLAEHQGKRLRDIYEQEPSVIRWLAGLKENEVNRPYVRAARGLLEGWQRSAPRVSKREKRRRQGAASRKNRDKASWALANKEFVLEPYEEMTIDEIAAHVWRYGKVWRGYEIGDIPLGYLAFVATNPPHGKNSLIHIRLAELLLSAPGVSDVVPCPTAKPSGGTYNLLPRCFGALEDQLRS